MSYGNNRTTDKYTKVKKASEKAPENEIRIRAVPRIGRYISYAAALLHGDEQKGQKAQDTVVLKASGNATKSACQIAEILRHKVHGLHQENILKTIPVIDEYEPKEEGLDKVVVERKLAVLEIHLSLKDGLLNIKAAGYQAPLPKDQVEEGGLKDIIEGKRPTDDSRPRQRGGRRGFRRGRYTGNRGGGRNQGERRGGDDREDRRDNREIRDNRDNRDYRRDDNGGERRNYENRGGERRNYENRGGERRGYDNRRNDDNRGERRDNNRGGERRDDNRDTRRNEENRGGERRNYDNRRNDDSRGERRTNNTSQKRNV